MARLTLTMYFMQGCSACEEVRPHVARIREGMRGRVNVLERDVDAVKVDFPILYTPTFSFQHADGRRAITDPVARKANLDVDELVKWMREIVQKWANGEPTE